MRFLQCVTPVRVVVKSASFSFLSCWWRSNDSINHNYRAQFFGDISFLIKRNGITVIIPISFPLKRNKNLEEANKKRLKAPLYPSNLVSKRFQAALIHAPSNNKRLKKFPQNCYTCRTQGYATTIIPRGSWNSGLGPREKLRPEARFDAVSIRLRCFEASPLPTPVHLFLFSPPPNSRVLSLLKGPARIYTNASSPTGPRTHTDATVFTTWPKNTVNEDGAHGSTKKGRRATRIIYGGW